MDNLNLAARLVTMDWNVLFEFYGAIFASFSVVVTMFGFLLLDEVLQQWEGYMKEEWEQAREVNLIPLPVVSKRVFYRNKKEYVAFCEELAFWPQEDKPKGETWDWPGSWISDGFLDMDDPEDRPLIDSLAEYDEFVLVECLEA